MTEPIIKRYEKNPILTKNDVPYEVSTVHNAGVTKYSNKYVMIFRAHEHNGRCVLGIAESDDGYSFKVRHEPFITPATKGVFSEYEEYGVEDPRICKIGDDYLITYSAYSKFGVRIALAKTKDFKKIKRIALISQPDMRNIVLFPKKINGQYVRLDRPHTEIMNWPICISYSNDLIYWGNSKVIMKPLTYHWDELKIGPGATPIYTKKGWLHIYHGVYKTMSTAVYRLGAALHELDDPSVITGVSDKWILEPQDTWEVTGYVPNVVFTCGAVPEYDGSVKIYWGGADTVMCAGTAKIDDLVNLCINNKRPPL